MMRIEIKEQKCFYKVIQRILCSINVDENKVETQERIRANENVIKLKDEGQKDRQEKKKVIQT